MIGSTHVSSNALCSPRRESHDVWSFQVVDDQAQEGRDR